MLKKILFTATAIVTLMSISSFATPLTESTASAGWRVEGNAWHFYNNQGDMITSDWKKSGDNWYWLDENGNLATDRLVESGSDYYYVDEHGAMIRESWMKLLNSDGSEQRWMYFGSTGRAYKSIWKKIGNFNYHFDSDGYMDYGWLDSDGNMLDADVDDPWKTATFYCGTEDDGARKSGWVKTETTDSDIKDTDIWLFFGDNGRKYVDKTAAINNKKYTFDTNGMMVTEFTVATNTNYYDKTNGNMLKKGWVWTSKDDESDEHWYYANNSGKIVTNQIKKINNKWYAFDAEGRMLTGLVLLDEDNTPVAQYDLDAVTKDFIINLNSDYMIFKDEADGSAYTNTCKIELEDDSYSFKFTKNGKPDTKKDYLYVNGLLIKASDDKQYEIVYINSREYLVNKSGKIITKKGTYKDSSNNIRYDIDENGAITSDTY